MIHSFVNQLCHYLAIFGESWLLPTMLLSFALGIGVRLLIYYTVRGEFTFAKEFETRVHRHLDGEYPEIGRSGDFSVLTQELLEKTFEECFNLRATHVRRKLDRTLTFLDRLFLVEEGSKRMIHDTVRQTKHCTTPEFDGIAQSVILSNPYFNRLIGVMPIALSNDVLNVMPSLFIIGGVFATFLGIMLGLPELRGLDIANVAATKAVLDGFLLKMAASMNASILGIALAVVLTVVNTVLSPSDMVVAMTDKFKLSLEFIWSSSRGHVPGRTAQVERPAKTGPHTVILGAGIQYEQATATSASPALRASPGLSEAARLLKQRASQRKSSSGSDAA